MFQPHERMIFTYEVPDLVPIDPSKQIGVKVVYADPLEICEKLEGALHGQADEKLQAFYGKDDAGRLEVFDEVKQAVHYAFGFPLFDPATGQGTLYETWYRALGAYLDFFSESEANTEPPPTSAPLLEPALSSQAG